MPEHDRVREVNTSIIDLTFTYNILEILNFRLVAPLRKSNHAVLYLEDGVSEGITMESEKKADPKRRYNDGNFTELNFFMNINWQMEFLKMSLEQLQESL